MRFVLVVLLSVGCIELHAQPLSKKEKKIIEYINEHMPQTLKLLEESVNINSGTLNVKGVRDVGNHMGEEFGKIGFKTEWIALPDSLKRAGHLVATVKGKKGKKLLLIGHLDTVFEPDMQANPYRVLNDSTATGQGVNDMKGGNILILAALQALHHAGALKDVTITAYFMGDEEKAGKPQMVSRADIIERAQTHDIALAFETAQNLNTVAIGRRGVSDWQLRTYGTQAHSAGVFGNGYGAIYEAARILNSFREQLGGQRYLTFNPGVFIGGTEISYDSSQLQGEVSGKTNIISPEAVVQGDLRFLRAGQLDSARAIMKTIVSGNNLYRTTASITFTDGIPAMEPTEGNGRLVQQLNSTSLALGLGETKAGDPGSRGAGDISYIAKYIDSLDGLGASGRGAHAPGETINLKEYHLLIQRAAIFIYRLTR